MELLQLRYFLKSAETENFSVTAAEYIVPASSVSASIKKLEAELGVKLFDREANKIRLNLNGVKFARAVSASLSALDGEIARIKEERCGISGDIYLLIKSDRSLITDKMTEFRKKYPAVNFHLVHSYTVSDYSKYHIVIDEDSDKYRGFKKEALVKEKIRIAASINNPLVNKKIKISDLEGVPFITMSQNSSLYRITEEICLSCGFVPNIVIESDDPYYVRKYISEDFGIALFPEKSWKFDMEKIKFLDVSDFDCTRSTYAYLNSTNKSPAAKAFFEYCRNSAE